ncbi:hypothetical protein BC629DRAFT_1599715 [Irpex lacteus]|nr:hypothetical protein BC629DRAFT_1599715 [Irpex lacteus]
MRVPCGRFAALAGIALSFVSVVEAQDFAVPSNWRKPTSNLTRQDRLSLVNGILNTISRTLNPETGIFSGLDSFQISESASMLSALSTGDIINGSTTNKDVVLKSLNTMFTNIPNITSFANPIKENRDPATWGLAAITAYRAYKDPSTLGYAESMWAQLSAFLVRPEDAASGKHPSRTVNISSTCNGATTAGAVFSFSTNSSALDVAGVTVETYMALSAHLYEETSNSSYLDTATLSADFIKNQLYNGVIIQDGINLGTCTVGLGPFTYDSGLTIDGLSALAASNSSYAPFLSSLISTVIPYPAWTNSSNGIITEGPSEADAPSGSDFTYTLKGIYVRGLYEAYRRLPSNSSEAGLIRSYLTVQVFLIRIEWIVVDNVEEGS